MQFIIGRHAMWNEDDIDRMMILGLITVSWFDLLGCVRAMLDDGSALTSNAAVAGLAALALLISVEGLPAPPRILTLVLLFPPVFFLVLLRHSA